MAVSKLRWVELTLCVLGVSLVGVAFGQTALRWNDQAVQERALMRGPAVSRAVSPAVAVQPEIPVEKPIAPIAVAPPRIPSKRAAIATTPAAYARIEIPRLGVAAMIKEGDDEKTLARAVGLVPGSARPGELGNTVLAGHRDTFFRPLRKIELNDRIRVIVPPHTYEYRVRSMRIVAPEETSVLASTGVEELTLVTCYPFRFVGPSPDRFIVNATRVE